jgi:chemotaxis protein methyltransferase CheR
LAAERCKADVNRVRILATDISTKVLCQAFRGIYARERVESLEDRYRRFFDPFDARQEGNFEPLVRVNNELRGITIFRRINLCDPSLNVPGEIDVVFLRNVLLYFDTNMIRQILSKCESKLTPGGYLYVGASESVGEYVPRMEIARPCVFRSSAKRRGSEMVSGSRVPNFEEPIHA